jgi:hypothetical protein
MGCLESRTETLSRRKGELYDKIRALQFGIQLDTRTYDRIGHGLVFYGNLEKRMKRTGFNYHLYPRVKETLLKLKKREASVTLRLEQLTKLISTADQTLRTVQEELDRQFL